MRALETSTGRLQQVLWRGDFAITAETTPPLTADPSEVVARTEPLCDLVDAVNITDGAGARAHLSGLAAAYFMARDNGLEAVLQFTTRDRNKLALERDLLGAGAFGVPNVLCLSGDPIQKGDEPEATAVNDLDSTGLVGLAALLRDDGRLPSGREIMVPPRYLIGVADTPLDPPTDWRPAGLERKIAAGADFVQCQFCFDPTIMRRYAARLVDLGITERVRILAGIGPLASARQARWIRDNLPGSIVPDDVIARLEDATDTKAEGRLICAELMQQLDGISGMAGVHLMGPRVEEEAALTILESGLRKRETIA